MGELRLVATMVRHLIDTYRTSPQVSRALIEWGETNASWLAGKTAYPVREVALASEIPVGGSRLFTYPGPNDPCILIRPSENEFAAYSQKCTHLSCAVYYKHEKNQFECPCHQGYFAAKDGRVLQGPPQRPLPRILLQQKGDELFAVGVDLGEA
jgi:Rieske Fe-S protein